MQKLMSIKITNLKGIGPKVCKYFNRLGIETIYDLITYYPCCYQELKNMNLKEADHDLQVIVEGVIESNATIVRYGKNKSKITFRFATNEMVVSVVLFNRHFLLNKLIPGKNLVVIGKWDKYKNQIIASEIRFETLGKETKIEPIYHLTEGLTHKSISKYINMALSYYGILIEEIIPNEIISKYKLLPLKDAIYIIHAPKNLKEALLAKNTLKYHELFLFSVKLEVLKKNRLQEEKGIRYSFEKEKLKEFISNLPFSLTKDQENAVWEIVSDLEKPYPMNRLLQGDVGSGKTIVATLAIYTSYLSGYQAALMVPTEILAEQHFQTMKNLFPSYNLNVELITGKTQIKEKEKIYDALVNGEINLIIGTHALIQEKVKFKKLGLVITDEQHRFGVKQRKLLNQKEPGINVLYMSATPIPRTYALTLFGDMDISTIKTMPEGRKEIITNIYSEKEIIKALELIYKEVKKGHQGYIIVPLIEESEKIELENINIMSQKLKKAFKDHVKIGIIHGRLSALEKDEVMNEFVEGKLDVLLSTTVIEVGINVSNATFIVIFNAERFGLSQLHQLRGRVGRSTLQSYCVLITNIAKERLDILTKTNDGFLISEEDLKQRGPGEFFGTLQSGIIRFKLANIVEDFKLLRKTLEDAHLLLDRPDFETNKSYKFIKSIADETLKNLTL